MATNRNAKRYGGHPPVATKAAPTGPNYSFKFVSWLYWMNADVEGRRASITLFANKLIEAESAAHVTYEMDWSDKYFETAARAEVGEYVLTLLSQGHSAVEIRWEIERKVAQMARDRRHSTSSTSNLMDGYRLEMFASFLSDHGSFGKPTPAMQLHDALAANGIS